MARTQSADYEDRREDILRAAARLFARGGYHLTSIADIARACGFSKSLLYHYFGSKEAMLEAIMASHIDLLVADVEAVLAEGGAAVLQLDRLIHRFMRHYAGAADRQKLVLNELHSLPPESARAIIAKQRRIVDAVQQLLVAIDPALGGNPARARVQTMLLFGMINWAHTWYRPAGPIGPDTLADMVMGLVTRGEGGGLPERFSGPPSPNLLPPAEEG